MLRRLLDGWLRAAARSWPSEDRAGLVREWRAELSALEAVPGRSAVVRTWQRVWFAGSLLLARRAGFDGVAGSVSHVDGPIWPTVVLFVTPILGVFPVVGPILTDIAAPSPVANVALATFATAALIGVGSVVGIVVGGRLAARSGPFSGVRAWLAVLVLVPVLCGVAVVGTTPAPRSWDPNPNPGAGIALAVVGAGLLGLFLVPAGALMSWAAARIRSRRGLGLLLVGLSGAVTLATIAATVWLDGDRPGWATGPGWWLGLVDGVQAGHYRATTIPLDARPIELALLRLPGVVLVGATVVLAFILRRSAAAPVPVATRPGPIAGAQPGPGRWWSSTLLLGAACCLVVWAVALTDVTPHVGGLKVIPSEILPPGLVDPWSGWSKEEGRVWTQDMQLGAIVAALLFFLCAAAYRALPLAPGLITAAVLLVIDMVVVRLGLLRLGLLPWLIGTGLLLGLFAWRRAHRPARTIDPGRGPVIGRVGQRHRRIPRALHPRGLDLAGLPTLDTARAGAGRGRPAHPAGIPGRARHHGHHPATAARTTMDSAGHGVRGDRGRGRAAPLRAVAERDGQRWVPGTHRLVRPGYRPRIGLACLCPHHRPAPPPVGTRHNRACPDHLRRPDDGGPDLAWQRYSRQYRTRGHGLRPHNGRVPLPTRRRRDRARPGPAGPLGRDLRRPGSHAGPCTRDLSPRSRGCRGQGEQRTWAAPGEPRVWGPR